MVLWLWNERGAHRIEDPRVVPSFFLHAPPSELPAIRRRIEILDGVRDVRKVQKRIALEDDDPRPSWRSCRGMTATSALSRTSSTRTAGTATIRDCAEDCASASGP